MQKKSPTSGRSKIFQETNSFIFYMKNREKEGKTRSFSQFTFLTFCRKIDSCLKPMNYICIQIIKIEEPPLCFLFCNLYCTPHHRQGRNRAWETEARRGQGNLKRKENTLYWGIISLSRNCPLIVNKSPLCHQEFILHRFYLSLSKCKEEKGVLFLK